MNTLIGLVSGYAVWGLSSDWGATNPSGNGILFGALTAILLTLYDILKEIRCKK